MDRLPGELLLLIGKHIEQFPRYHKTLSRLTLCCRRFYDVFQFLIYRYIPCHPFTPAFVHLIIRLWKKPKLASQVRHLYVEWSCYDTDRFHGLDNNKDEADFIEDALNEIFTTEEEEMQSLWRKRLNGTDPLRETSTQVRNGLHSEARTEAWLGLLLVRVNNLQKIEFRFEESDLIHTILHKPAKREKPFHKHPPFPHLQEVRGEIEWGQPPIESEFLNPFFYFPAVRKVYGFGIGEEDDEDFTPLEIGSTSCPVREITVDEGFWCVGMLNWLAMCTKLEHLAIRISLEPEYYHINPRNVFSASQYRLALLRFATTLKSLHICFNDRYKHALEQTAGAEVPFGTFTDFAVMEHLTVRHAHLTGPHSPHSKHHWGTKQLVQILPSSLRRLEIKDVVEDHELHLLLELLELVHRGPCENLEKLVLHFYPKDDDDDAIIDALNRLQLDCEAKGVRFKTITESVDGDPGRSLEFD